METELVERLRACRVCRGLNESEISRVAAACSWRELESGEFLTTPGETVFALYIVTRGRLRIEHHQDGQDRVVGYVNHGETVGQASFLSDEFNEAIGYVAEIATEVAVINRHRALRLIFEIPRFRKHLIAGFGLRVENIFSGQKLRRFPKIVGVVSEKTDVGRRFLPRLCHELAQRNETISVFTDRSNEFEDLHPFLSCQRLTPNGPAEDLLGEIQRQLAVVNRVLIDIAVPEKSASLGELTRECDEVVWCCGNEKPDPTTEGQLRDLVKNRPTLKSRLVFVQLLATGQTVGRRLPCCPGLIHRDFLLPMEDQACRRLYQQGMDRIVRHLRGIKIGLALGGGGARGLSHLGVLRALDRAGVSVDIMSGTSSGAMIGLGYAAGIPAESLIRSFTSELKPPSYLTKLPGGRRLFLFAKFRMRAWESMLRKYYHDWTFAQLPIPFLVAVTDLVSGDQVIRESGDIVQAILESINVPVLADPILRDGQILVDGGVVNNLPIELLNDRGAEFVIGVDASKEIPTEFGGNSAGMRTGQMKRPGRIETAYRVMDVSRRGIAQLQMNLADIVIEPDTSAFDFADFTSAEQIAEQGEIATEKILPRILRLYEELMTD